VDASTAKIWSLSRSHGLLPIHRVLLGHDGSMTNLLELISCCEVVLRTIKQSVVPCPQEAVDLLAVDVGEPANERDITIVRSSDGSPLLYARSYTPLSRLKPAFKADLMRADIPIGKIMQKHKIEARREIMDVGYLSSDRHLEDILARSGPYLWRTYNIITQRKPLITVKEYFPVSL
jgi:beta-ribofuranosylaminobenzene 5'-phosphate synthase